MRFRLTLGTFFDRGINKILKTVFQNLSSPTTCTYNVTRAKYDATVDVSILIGHNGQVSSVAVFNNVSVSLKPDLLVLVTRTVWELRLHKGVYVYIC